MLGTKGGTKGDDTVDTSDETSDTWEKLKDAWDFFFPNGWPGLKSAGTVETPKTSGNSGTGDAHVSVDADDGGDGVLTDAGHVAVTAKPSVDVDLKRMAACTDRTPRFCGKRLAVPGTAKFAKQCAQENFQNKCRLSCGLCE